MVGTLDFVNKSSILCLYTTKCCNVGDVRCVIIQLFYVISHPVTFIGVLCVDIAFVSNSYVIQRQHRLIN